MSRLYESIADHLSSLVERGSLLPGDKLPSVRSLATQHGVSIATVLRAYVLLESRGLIEVRPQSGHYVRPRLLAELPEPRTPKLEQTARAVTVADRVARLYESVSGALGALGVAVPHPSLLPTEKLAQSMAREARRAPTAGVEYGAPAGVRRLRRELARRSSVWGTAIAADDFIITVGAMEALQLCLRAVARRGDTIAVETPAFFGVLQLIECLGLKVLEIPARPGTGLDLVALDAALRRRRVCAILACPSFNNPLGSRMPDAARRELAQLLARYDVPLIEDDVYGDLHFDEPRPRLVYAFDRKGLVLLCSSFSKTLAPGYRVGWVVPGRYRSIIERMKFAQSVSTPVLPQMAIADFLASGGYDRHLRSLRRKLREQIARYTHEITSRFPPGTRLSRPEGGFVLWVELPPTVHAYELSERAILEGAAVAPGPIFSASGHFEHSVRISCGYPWSPQVERSLQTVARIAAELHGSASRPASMRQSASCS